MTVENTLHNAIKYMRRPEIRTSVPDYIERQGMSAGEFAHLVQTLGGGRNAAYKLARGETNVAPHNMLIASQVLGVRMEYLFVLHWSNDRE